MKQILSTKNKAKQIQFDRSLLFAAILVGVGIVVIVQLFFIQIVKHEYYTAAALAEHAKKFDLPAPRGTISMTDGYKDVPVVLNETKYEVFADPTYIQDTKAAAKALQGVIGGELEEIEKQLSTESRYVILAKRIDNAIADRIRDLEIKGVGLKDVPTRSYPQGTLAAHVLGFVNDEGQGQYGFEEYYNQKLTGINGSQTKITDINGVPLAINNKDNEVAPIPGANVNLTLDLRMQQIVEEKLKANVERTQSKLGSAVLIDATNGQIKAMANYPTYDPSQFSKQEDLSVFINTAISRQWEPGSVIKPLMMSAAFNENKLNINSSYFDNGSVQVADRVIKNSQNWGSKTMNMTDIITKSLNVGAVHMLKSLGDGQINDQARNTWFDYLNRFNFGKKTGVELAGEQNGIVVDPNDVNGVMVRYANMSFGQGMTTTPLQLAAAYVPLANGGTYYQPYLIQSEITKDGKVEHEPKIISSNVMSPETSQAVKSILQTSVERNNKAAVRAGYAIGAKSGTAELVGDDGEYKEGSYNGTYVGYVSGKNKTYVLVVRLDEPKTSGYASTQASITWEQITNEMLNSVAVEPL